MAFGALFKVKEKKAEKFPDYHGTIEVDADFVKLAQSGISKLELSGWLRTSKAGNKYISLRVTAPYEKKDGPPKNNGLAADEIPF